MTLSPSLDSPTSRAASAAAPSASQAAPAGAAAVQPGQPRVAAVLLNWRRPDDIQASIVSVAASNYAPLQVVVVDNGSANGSVAAIRRRFPDVTLVENGRNLGFAGGCNVGIRVALEQLDAEYVLLLNDDTEVAPDMLRTLVEAAERDPRIGMAGPTICYYDRPDVVWSAGGSVDRFGEPSHLALDATARPGAAGATDAAVQDVDYLTGCALLVRRRVIETVGAFDERFFAYFEETEWCARARRAGFRVALVPSARMWHKIPSADRGDSPAYIYLMTRNRLLYLRCTGAPLTVVLRAAVDLLRTAAAWTLKPRHRAQRPLAGPLLRGLWHAARGRFGPPPARL